MSKGLFSSENLVFLLFRYGSTRGIRMSHGICLSLCFNFLSLFSLFTEQCIIMHTTFSVVLEVTRTRQQSSLSLSLVLYSLVCMKVQDTIERIFHMARTRFRDQILRVLSVPQLTLDHSSSTLSFQEEEHTPLMSEGDCFFFGHFLPFFTTNNVVFELFRNKNQIGIICVSLYFCFRSKTSTSRRSSHVISERPDENGRQSSSTCERARIVYLDTRNRS